MKRDKCIVRWVKTGVCMLLFSAIWMMLELIFYGQIQDRMMDNLLFIILIPVFYRAINTAQKNFHNTV